jgi:hypothetical protein
LFTDDDDALLLKHNVTYHFYASFSQLMPVVAAELKISTLE